MGNNQDIHRFVLEMVGGIVCHATVRSLAKNPRCYRRVQEMDRWYIAPRHREGYG